MSAAGRRISTSMEFLSAVLRLHPRVAAFDADGTLWAPDAGEQFFYWEAENGVMPAEVARWALPRYEDYRRGRVGESQMCGEMVTLHAGLRVASLQQAAEDFFREHIEPHIFPGMRELTHRLREEGCELWAVSSSNEWLVGAAARRFAIPQEHVLAAAAASEEGVITDRLLRVPTDADKAAVLKEVLSGPPDAAFGNSLHDLAMLEMARHAFAVNPNPDLEAIAGARGWTVYRPGKLS